MGISTRLSIGLAITRCPGIAVTSRYSLAGCCTQVDGQVQHISMTSYGMGIGTRIRIELSIHRPGVTVARRFRLLGQFTVNDGQIKCIDMAIYLVGIDTRQNIGLACATDLSWPGISITPGYLQRFCGDFIHRQCCHF